MKTAFFPDNTVLEALATVALTREIESNPTKLFTMPADVQGGAQAIAYDAIVYSDEVAKVIGIYDKSADFDENNNPEAEKNAVGDSTAFEIGFELALKLGARVALGPLSEQHISDIVAEMRVKYADSLRKARRSRKLEVCA